MNHQIFTWGNSRNQLRNKDFWLESFYVIGLLTAAVVLYTVNLGHLPLRDWDEATIAQVAKEIYQAPKESYRWLFPTLWGEPYLNKPPLVHTLIAFFYHMGGVNEWTSRLPTALLSAFCVPLLYGIGREIFTSRKVALLAALSYLTWLPMVRHGRLTMLDGPIVCFELLMIWSVLRSRRDLRWSLGIGISLGLMCLTKGILGLLLGGIAFLFIFWDIPRLLSSIYLWLGIILGMLPVMGWYFLQWRHYSDSFISVGVFSQSLARVYSSVDNNSGPPWYYLLEIAKYSWPWLFFAIVGIKICYQNRIWGWSKLILVWSGVYLLVVSLMGTKLPWYIIPIYPPLALATAVTLSQGSELPNVAIYPKSWTRLFLFLFIATSGGTIYVYVTTQDYFLTMVAGCVAITMGFTAALLHRRDSQFLWILFWGMYLSLFAFMSSPHWLWELNEAYPVKPVAAIVRFAVPKDVPVYTSFSFDRPSLNFYSHRPVISSSKKELKAYWKELSQPYLLIDSKTLTELELEDVKTLGKAPPDWWLITKSTLALGNNV